jgi:hypothetical protein
MKKNGQMKSYFEHVIETSERFDEQIGAFVRKLVSSGDEEVKCFVQVKVVMTVKVTSDEFVDFVFGDRVQVLEFVQCTELFHVQPVRRDDVRLTFEQMFRFNRRDFGDRREDVSRVNGRSFHTVPVIDLAIAGFLVHVKLVEIVVKVDVAGAQVSTEQSGVGGEDGGDSQLAHTTQHQTTAGQPFVEVSHNVGLSVFRFRRREFDEMRVELFQEPGDTVAEKNGVVRLTIVPRHSDVTSVPEVVFPFVQLPTGGSDVEQYHLRISVDQPPAVNHSNSKVFQTLNGRPEQGLLLVQHFDFGSNEMVVDRPEQTVLITQLFRSDLSLRPNHRVNAAHLTDGFGTEKG